MKSQKQRTKIPEFLATSKKGIALLVALATTIIILILGSVVIYLIVRGLGVTTGQSRYELSYEAAVAALEIGKAGAENLNVDLASGPVLSYDSIVGKYPVNIIAERSSATSIVMSGTAIKFSRAIAGPGATPASGSYRTYYVSATATGPTGEQVGLELLQRYTAQTE